MRLFLLLLLATLASSDTVVYGLNGVIIKDNFNAQTTASSEVRYIHKYCLLFIEVRSKKKSRSRRKRVKLPADAQPHCLGASVAFGIG